MPKQDYEEIACVHDPVDNLVQAPITRRVSDNGDVSISFALFRKFKDGDERTCWFGRRHLPALERTIAELKKELDKIVPEMQKAVRGGR